MRALILLLLVALLAPAFPVQAQDVFKSEEYNEEDVLDELGRILGLDGHDEQQLDNMDETELINRYYKFCVEKKDPVLSEFRQEHLCGCTTANMKKTMTKEELRDMYRDTREGGFQRSRVMAFSKIPCIEEPLRDTLYEACMTNPNITGSLHRAKKVCQCIADEMGDFAMGKGAAILGATERGGIVSPDALLSNSAISDFMNSQTYEWKSQHFTTICIYKHEYGI